MTLAAATNVYAMYRNVVTGRHTDQRVPGESPRYGLGGLNSPPHSIVSTATRGIYCTQTDTPSRLAYVTHQLAAKMHQNLQI